MIFAREIAHVLIKGEEHVDLMTSRLKSVHKLCM